MKLDQLHTKWQAAKAKHARSTTLSDSWLDEQAKKIQATIKAAAKTDAEYEAACEYVTEGQGW
jgi:hypothetical protein